MIWKQVIGPYLCVSLFVFLYLCVSVCVWLCACLALVLVLFYALVLSWLCHRRQWRGRRLRRRTLCDTKTIGNTYIHDLATTIVLWHLHFGTPCALYCLCHPMLSAASLKDQSSIGVLQYDSHTRKRLKNIWWWQIDISIPKPSQAKSHREHTHAFRPCPKR